MVTRRVVGEQLRLQGGKGRRQRRGRRKGGAYNVRKKEE